ncbi:hypothetical protein MUO32_15405 [Shinella sp. CPCC 101442]|uniref:hypothetical protein n=1 Tax=Shinella sp. CPCC 101442 TaxID=2932265 RepID=UPI002152E79A|nr:hypothetical protein [Shinella sp. CPCC 101442]MCR6500437.1 hypothetical protein [Shinella sp. CPCC 101442]
MGNGVAHAEDLPTDPAAFELTPQILAALAECRAPRDVLGEVGMALFMGGTVPAWLTPVDADGHDGMMGLETFDLKEPITVFGAPATRISFLQEWVVTERDYDAALATIQKEGMKRAPIRLTEQYYRFVHPESGPMIGAFAPTDDALAVLLGMPAEAGKPKTMFVGCNYTVASQEEFLDAAGKADAMAGDAARDIEDMLEGEP